MTAHAAAFANAGAAGVVLFHRKRIYRRIE